MNNPATSPLLSAALAYAAKGISVFPLEVSGKRPLGRLVQHGVKEATTDPEKIAEWWTAEPEANIGIACGNGLLVVDLDIDASAKLDGIHEFSALVAQHGEMPTTATARTPRGGRHIYLRGDGKNTASKLAPGIDTRGAGGYVVAPPSRTEAGEWTWCDGRGIAEAPAWLIGLVLADNRPAPTSPRPRPQGRREFGGTRYGLGALEDECAAVASEGQGNRNNRLNVAALKLGALSAGGELEWGTVEGELLSAALACGLGETEARKTIQSGMATGAKNPRTKPEPTSTPAHEAPPPTDDDAPPEVVAAKRPSLAPPRRRFPSNDLENAERFTAEHGQSIRYVYAWNAWPSWDGRRWNRDAPHIVERLAAETTRGMLDEAITIEDDEDRKRAVKHACSSHSAGKRKAMVESAQHMLVAQPGDFDSSPWLLNVENGILDLRTGELRPHDPEAMLARLATVAYHEDAQCPLWLAFLGRVLDNDSELIAFVRRAVGYTLTGSRREQCMFLMIGATGCNGKSVFIKVLSEILGDYHSDIAFKTLLFDSKGHGKDPELAELDGPRLVTAAEPNPGERLDESLIKRLTGGDPITAARKYERPVTFDPVCKLWVACNAPPRLMTGGNAMRRRLAVVPFDITIPPEEQDENLVTKLLAERDGILAWAVEGCLSWQESGLRMPERVTTARDAYIEDSDPISEWLGTLTRRPGDRASMKAVYNSYKAHVEAAGHKPKDSKGLVDLLREHGFNVVKSHGARWLLDVETPDALDSDSFQKDFANASNY